MSQPDSSHQRQAVADTATERPAFGFVGANDPTVLKNILDARQRDPVFVLGPQGTDTHGHKYVKTIGTSILSVGKRLLVGQGASNCYRINGRERGHIGPVETSVKLWEDIHGHT